MCLVSRETTEALNNLDRKKPYCFFFLSLKTFSFLFVWSVAVDEQVLPFYDPGKNIISHRLRHKLHPMIAFELWRWPILCLTLITKPKQSSHCGGTFDQLLLLCRFRARCFSTFSTPLYKTKIKAYQKLKVKGVGMPCLDINIAAFFLSEAEVVPPHSSITYVSRLYTVESTACVLRAQIADIGAGRCLVYPAKAFNCRPQHDQVPLY